MCEGECVRGCTWGGRGVCACGKKKRKDESWRAGGLVYDL